MVEEREQDGLQQEDRDDRQERRPAMLNLTVPEDHMTAFMDPEDEALSGLDPQSLKDLLERAGIRHGVVDDGVLSDYFSRTPIHERPWKVAEGNPPDPGKESSIRYCFNTDPLIVGMEDESGKIDFKNRGEIPQVKAGELLAEIVPGIPGRDGIDIFGKSVPAPDHRPVKVLPGKGAYSHPDGLHVYAQINGRPELTPDGKICVFPDLVIPGDVGYATGHVEFDGDVEVRGAILDGFRVRAQDLRAGEINKADVVAGGNIVVSGGIIGSRLQADGTLQCRHIHTSTVEVLGDIAVETTIFDSEIRTNGRCVVNNGRILSSTVSAKMGVQAVDIGSESSEACDLLVGVDGFLKSTVDKLNAEVDLCGEKLRELETRLAETEEEAEKLETEIGDLAQEEDRTRTQFVDMEQKIKLLTDSGESGGVVFPKAKELYRLLEQKLDRTTKNLEAKFNLQESLEERIKQHKSEIHKVYEHINSLKEQIERERELSSADKGSPAVKVTGAIYSGTVVRGPKAIIKLKDDYRNVTIKEAQTDRDDVRVKWSMEVVRLR